MFTRAQKDSLGGVRARMLILVGSKTPVPVVESVRAGFWWSGMVARTRSLVVS